MASSKQQTQTSSANTSETSPSAFQLPYLSQAFNAASNAFDTSQNNANTNQPNGFTAQFTPAMMDAFRQELGYGTGNLGVAGNTANLAGDLSDPARAGVSAGLYGLAGFNPMGAVPQNISAATSYANSPYTSDMVKGAMRDANQEYTDITAPGINRNSAGTGNINSSTNPI